MIEIRPTHDPRADKLREISDADIAMQAEKNERNEAYLAYIAMMTDVDIPIWEEDEDE